MHIKESSIWVKTNTESMVWKNLWILNEPRFTKSKVYSNLYYKVENDGIMILLLYVDDLFLTGKENLMSECKKKLALEFEMKDLGNDALFPRS